MSGLSRKVKDQAIVSLGLTYQVRIITRASTVFQKSTFHKFSHLNA